MPANLTPDYKAAEQRFRQAKTTEDKIAAIQEMMAVIPRHKGTDRIWADLRRRLAQLKESQQQEQKHGGRRGASHFVPKEDVPQVIVLGTPNVGKSSLVAATTNARPEIADYPFTTRAPGPAMMPFEDINIQLVDVPPVSPEHTETWLPELIRNADAALLVVDLSADDCVDAYEFLRSALASRGIRLSRVHDPSETEVPRNVKPTLIVANKVDAPNAAENLQFLTEVLAGAFDVVAVSALHGQGIEDMKRALFVFLDIIRIYSKIPGKKPDMEKPFIVKRGSTVADVASKIHRDFGEKVKSARVWGSAKFDGQVVDRLHVVQDRDVVEVHVEP
jgi:ribosome-interacting GTPase 1